MMMGGFDTAWLPGLGSAPGGVDFISVGPDGGTTAKAVTLGEARSFAVLLAMGTGNPELLKRLEVLVGKARTSAGHPADPPSWVRISEAS